MDRTLPVWIGIDASVKHDSTALVAVGFYVKAQQVRLINHRIFTPSPDRPIDFERQVEQTVLDWHGRYRVRSVRFDPYQMVPVSQRLTREGAPMQEFPQTSGNLTEMSSNLYELVTGRNIVVYPNEEIRLAVARAVAVEGTRGPRTRSTSWSPSRWHRMLRCLLTNKSRNASACTWGLLLAIPERQPSRSTWQPGDRLSPSAPASVSFV